MPFCPTCHGTGKLREGYNHICPDCDGKGIITDNELKFIEYYHHRKSVKYEIDMMESDVDNIPEMKGNDNGIRNS